ncbi:hypothetical protein BDV25DRAFT_79214 [Aspergillus avenaceus]|uniref:Uncharacterized protein n=1 Tax=Aspergillus avenaceus TaxID=36643 RepID=A0A5N6U0A2_ASPAV|nr:hypothetical protein BDV25DRAFT_79214 [Aspergillus avenaceus]
MKRKRNTTFSLLLSLCEVYYFFFLILFSLFAPCDFRRIQSYRLSFQPFVYVLCKPLK